MFRTLRALRTFRTLYSDLTILHSLNQFSSGNFRDPSRTEKNEMKKKLKNRLQVWMRVQVKENLPILAVRIFLGIHCMDLFNILRFLLHLLMCRVSKQDTNLTKLRIKISDSTLYFYAAVVAEILRWAESKNCICYASACKGSMYFVVVRISTTAYLKVRINIHIFNTVEKNREWKTVSNIKFQNFWWRFVEKTWLQIFIGVTTLLCYYSVKEIHLTVQGSYCQSCRGKIKKDTPEYFQCINNTRNSANIIIKASREKWRWLNQIHVFKIGGKIHMEMISR